MTESEFIKKLNMLSEVYGATFRANDTSIVHLIKKHLKSENIGWIILGGGRVWGVDLDKAYQLIEKDADEFIRDTKDKCTSHRLDKLEIEKSYTAELKNICSELDIELVLDLGSGYRELILQIVDRYRGCFSFFTKDIADETQRILRLNGMGSYTRGYESYENAIYKLYGGPIGYIVSEIVIKGLLFEIQWLSNSDSYEEQLPLTQKYISVLGRKASAEGQMILLKKTIEEDVAGNYLNLGILQLNILLDTNFLDKTEWPWIYTNKENNWEGNVFKLLSTKLSKYRLKESTLNKAMLLGANEVNGVSLYEMIIVDRILRVSETELKYRETHWEFKDSQDEDKYRELNSTFNLKSVPYKILQPEYNNKAIARLNIMIKISKLKSLSIYNMVFSHKFSMKFVSSSEKFKESIRLRLTKANIADKQFEEEFGVGLMDDN